MNTETDNNLYKAILSAIVRHGIFNTFINEIPMRIYIKDTHGKFLTANKAVADFVGVANPDDVTGKTDFDFFPKEQARRYFDDEQEIIHTGKPVLHKEEPKLDKSGVKREIFVTKMPVTGDDGKVIGLLGFSTDLTERIQAEEKLIEERNSLRTLINTLPDFIYVKDTQSRFTLSNTLHTKFLGLNSPEDIIGKTDFDFFPKDIASSFFADEQEIIRTGKPLFQKDEISPSLHGNTVRVLTTKIPLKDITGKIIGIVGVSHDITSIIRMEKNLGEVNTKLSKTLNELKQSQEQIIQSERLRALGQMASGITHDFNNALTPILGYSDLLINGPGILEDKNATLNMLKDIRTAALDAAQTVRRLSEFYAPARKTERKPVDVAKLIESTVGMTRPLWKEEMAAKNVSINMVTRLDSTGNVFGNESQLREMLTNLVFNAVDAMPRGGTLTLKTRTETPFIVIEVTDTGIGMSDEIRSQCFEPFFTTKHKRGGGLGLSMVHGIVRQHSGEIEVKSSEGKGSTFTIRLPETTMPVEQEKTRQATPSGAQQLNVLLIDDEEVVRQTIEACLKSDHHSVSSAIDGKHGLELFNKNKFDLVITDRAMPGISGDNVAVEIKKINPNIPVIMLTGFGHIMRDLKQCPAGVDLIVSKPVTRDSLRDSITKAFSHKKH
ncbi:MAG: hypothetical protein A2283_05025 [Lentisphaerae bacterium RIFOXYA12_FULL_48_11]|nr:MAG: hypothetical protein A2283_05025 [Lentisphaerae bacterium RIFOXYA12_FULL_48_11]